MTPSCCGACDTERAVSAILINVRCPKPEEAEGFMRSGAEPEWPEEMKAQHRRLWPLLSSQEQQLLAWRAKHFGKHQLSEFCPPRPLLGYAVRSHLNRCDAFWASLLGE